VTLSSLENVGLFSSMLSSPLSTEITKGASLPFWAGLALPAINAPMPRHAIQDKHYHKNDQDLHTVFLLSRVMGVIKRWYTTVIGQI